MNWRLASRLSVITLALLIVLVIAVLGLRNGIGGGATNNPNASATATNATATRNSIRGTATNNPGTSQSGLQGTNLEGVPAPDFHLRDQLGKPISLSQFKGKPVVLTFLYTHCPDVCPLTADKLHVAMQNLDNDAQQVTILAVSMDPKGDTAAAAQNFSRIHKLGDYFHFLIGTHNELAPVWSSYSVDAQAATSAGIVSHSTAIYVIDKQGRERILLDTDFSSAQVTTDLKILLGE